MVSIKYFCGVGEFCSVKSKPCGRFTSKTVAAGPAAHSTRVRTHDTRNRMFSNLNFLQSPSIARERRPCTPASRMFLRLAHGAGNTFFNQDKCFNTFPRRFYPSRRVDSRSTSLGGIRIFVGRIERFDAILSTRSSAASTPISPVP